MYNPRFFGLLTFTQSLKQYFFEIIHQIYGK